MTQSDRRCVGLVEALPEVSPGDAANRAGNLLLTGAPGAGHRLLDAQRGIFEHRQTAHRGHRDRRTTRGTQNLRGLEILHVNGLLNRHMRQLVLINKIFHLIADRAEAFDLRDCRLQAKCRGFEDAHLIRGAIIQHRKATAAQAGINAEH